MNIQTLLNELFRWCADGAPHDYSGTCDTLKTGNPETEVHKVAVSMFATPAVIRAAHEWGAELLIVHEPTFYAHMDDNFANSETIPFTRRNASCWKRPDSRSGVITIIRTASSKI